jgi:hypothetical protein
MNKGVVVAFLVTAAGTPALAQQTVRILTPTADTCRAYTAAMVSADKTAVTGLAGWVIGYLSGVAQATRTDFLHSEDVASLTRRLYDDCLKRPEMPLSIAAQGLVGKLIAGHRVH